MGHRGPEVVVSNSLEREAIKAISQAIILIAYAVVSFHQKD